jgi:hypothetical protein
MTNRQMIKICFAVIFHKAFAPFQGLSVTPTLAYDIAEANLRLLHDLREVVMEFGRTDFTHRPAEIDFETEPFSAEEEAEAKALIQEIEAEFEARDAALFESDALEAIADALNLPDRTESIMAAVRDAST